MGEAIIPFSKAALIILGLLAFNYVNAADFYLGFYKNFKGRAYPRVFLVTTESRPVYYTYNAPGVNFSGDGFIDVGSTTVITFPLNIEVSSITDQGNGIHVHVQSDHVTVLGQTSSARSSETFTAIPVSKLPDDEYVYYGMSLSSDQNDGGLRYTSILIVGTENNTQLTLNVTQQITAFINQSYLVLRKGIEYYLVIDEFQTLYLRSVNDLSGSKVKTDKPVSVLSGHECAVYIDTCSHQVEQMPPTKYWGKIFYTTPLVSANTYLIRILSAYTSTNITVYCFDGSIELTYSLDEGEIGYKKCSFFCTIHSNNPILVIQFSQAYHDGNTISNSMMTLVPAKRHYTSRFAISTMRLAAQSNFKHYINVLVTEKYFQKDKIFLASGNKIYPIGKDYDWIRIGGENNITEAYVMPLITSERRAVIYHSNKDALMTYMIYGFTGTDGYGHAATIDHNTGTKGSAPIITVSPSSQHVNLLFDFHELTLFCKAVGASSYRWERQNGDIPTSTTGIDTNALTFFNLDPKSAGNYRCVVSNDHGSKATDYATINITVLPPSITTQPSSQSINVTQIARFICRASGYRILYQWRIGSGSFPSKVTGINTNTLVISDVRSSDENTYTCIASNEGGNASSQTVKLTVKGNVDPPTISRHPTNMTVKLENSTTMVSLRCEANGATSYNWERQSGSIQSHATGINTTTLTIINLQIKDAGYYRCVAINNNGQSYSKYSKIIINVASPKLIKAPASQHVKLTQTAIFTCSAAGYSVQYEWTIGSESFPNKVTGINTNTLVIPDVRSSDDNTYTCVARNEGGRVSSHIAQLTVTGLPEVTVEPSIQKIEVTHNATFFARAKGIGMENFVYQWRRSNQIIPGETGPTFVIHNVAIKSSNYHTYWCEVRNEYGDSVTSERVKLIVTRNVPHFSIQPQSQTVLFNQKEKSVSLRCAAIGAKSYVWERWGGSIPYRAIGVNTDTLTIVNIQPEDDGIYRCVATNASGTSYSKYATLNVTVSVPIITSHPRNVTTPVYTTATFTCKVKSSVRVKITWKKHHSSLLPVAARIKVKKSRNEVTSTLKITSVIGYYSGEYYCIAQNKFGRVTSKYANLNVEVPCPVLLVAPVNATTLTGGSIHLKCLAFSLGSLKYAWKRMEGKSLPATAQRIPTIDGSHIVDTLSITNVQHADEGWYCCLASNECANITEICAWLEVEGISVVLQPKSRTFRVGSINISTLHFSVVEMGPTFYQWEKYQLFNNSWIKPSSRAVNTTSPSLVFSVITEEDEGVYHCVVTNANGDTVVSENATISVLDPPKPRIHPNYTSYHVSIDSLVTLNCTADGYPTPTVTWYKDGISIAEPETAYSAITIKTDLVNVTEYKCVATNVAGDMKYNGEVNITVNIERKCTPLQAPKHGVMFPQQPRNFNFVKRLIFFCNYGFTLQGSRSVDCGTAGKWSNAAPICV